MLGDMVGVKSVLIVGFGNLEARLVVVAQRQIIAIEVIEDAEFHNAESLAPGTSALPGDALPTSARRRRVSSITVMARAFRYRPQLRSCRRASSCRPPPSSAEPRSRREHRSACR